jgi:hypothetical protein
MRELILLTADAHSLQRFRHLRFAPPLRGYPSGTIYYAMDALRRRSETGAFCQKLRDNGEGVVFGALQWLMPLKRLMAA